MPTFSVIREIAQALWNALGPLAGVLLGVWLTWHWQHKHWVLDNKRAEYRQLLDALEAYRDVLDDHAKKRPFAPDDYKRDYEPVNEKQAALRTMLADRLFIGDRPEIVSTGKDFQDFLRKFAVELLPRNLSMSSTTKVFDALDDFEKRLRRAARDDLK